MTVKIRPWQTGDGENFNLQKSQQYLTTVFSENIETLAAASITTVVEAEGKIILIGGLIHEWENRASVWTLISEDAGKHFIAIHKAVDEFLKAAPYRRIEATVDVDFEQGHRWMKMLGFEPEGYMRAYRPDGADNVLYARIRR